jgi:hypothetical protein
MEGEKEPTKKKDGAYADNCSLDEEADAAEKQLAMRCEGTDCQTRS